MANNRVMLRRARIELQHVSNEGVITDLTYGGLTYWQSAIGFGMAPIKRLMEQGPDQDGVTDLGFRLDQRQAGLVLVMVGTSPEQVEAKQDRLYDLFKPRDIPYSLRLKRVGDYVRQIDCFTIQGPDFNSQEESEGTRAPIFRVAVQLYAPNPVFYDPNSFSQSFGITGGGGAWTIPWAIPWAIGSALIDQTAAIPYGGQWLEYPIITVVGPITDLIITNLVSGEVISFVGATINNGDTYTIDLRPGRKSVVDQNGVNKISQVANSSNLATWALLPSPDAPGGINSIRVQGNTATTITQVFIQYFNRYVGGR